MDISTKIYQKTDLKKFAYDEIKSRIIDCTYPPGEILNEQLLTKELNISRTPIREALNRLDHEGLIQILSKKGILIKNITLSDISQVYQLRIEVEPFIVKAAGPFLDHDKLIYFRDLFINIPEDEISNHLNELNTDNAFHKYLVDNCGNKYIIEMMNKVLDENMRIMIYTKNKIRIEDSKSEHISIIDSLLVNNFPQASERMLIHIKNCRDSAYAYLLNPT